MNDDHTVFHDGFWSPHPYNLTMIRKQADWLFTSIRQFQALELRGKPVPDEWKTQIRKFTDALLKIWDKCGQFGEFIDVQSGDLPIGNSVSAGRLPAALALASSYLHEPRYLAVAEAAAQKYYDEYVRKGILNGGAGEILSAPDSEAAFNTLESFVWRYEITGDRRWLTPARDLARQGATWTVSYDYHFPAGSAMASIDAHSSGAVWASVANKHGAPGICALSGDSHRPRHRAIRLARRPPHRRYAQRRHLRACQPQRLGRSQQHRRQYLRFVLLGRDGPDADAGRGPRTVRAARHWRVLRFR